MTSPRREQTIQQDFKTVECFLGLIRIQLSLRPFKAFQGSILLIFL